LIPLAVAGSVLLVILLIAYLIIQRGGGADLPEAERRAMDDSSGIPGTFVPVPTDRTHLPGGYPHPGTPVIPFCPGVAHSGSDISVDATSTASAAATSPTAESTATPTGAASSETPAGSPTPRADCYASNPPAGGHHLAVLNKVDVGNGNFIKIPPDPNVYPPDIDVPREGIPHILEHAGVFVGYN